MASTPEVKNDSGGANQPILRGLQEGKSGIFPGNISFLWYIPSLQDAKTTGLTDSILPYNWFPTQLVSGTTIKVISLLGCGTRWKTNFALWTQSVIRAGTRERKVMLYGSRVNDGRQPACLPACLLQVIYVAVHVFFYTPKHTCDSPKG